MDVEGWFERRIDATRFVGGVVLGDLLAITLFVAVGQTQHGGTPLARPLGIFEAAAPFYVAWLLVGLVAGLFTLDAVVSSRRAVSWAIPAWVVVVPIAIVLRPLAVSPYASVLDAVTFGFVSFVFGGLLLVGWRSVVPVVERHSDLGQ